MSTMQLLALGQLAMGSPITLAFCVVLVVVAVLAALKRTRSSRQIPRVGKAPGWFGLAEAKRDFIANGRLLIDEGYRKYKNSMFLVQTADMERIVLSPQYVDELRAAPESVLSLREGMSQNPQGDFVPTMNEEASFWLAEQISSTSTHAELTGYEAMLKIVTGMSSRIFVGQSLSKDERWLRMIVEYTIDVFLISTALRPYPAMIRPLIAPWLSSVKRMQRHLSIAQELFAPVFASSMSKESKSSRDYSVLEWMARSAQGGDRDPRILVKKLLFLTLAAIHTSTMSITHALFDLCEHTECIEPLREEIKAAVRTHGWTLPAVNSMKLLDSFLKESQRINHPGLLSFNRWVRSPLHLSDGTVLPANTFISMPTNSIAHDPELYKNPECFDVFRFLNKRLASQADAQRHQFVSTSSDSLPFGHGKFACPGRFFAAAQIKIVLANIIMKYDVSFPDSQTRRPDNVFTGEGIAPDRKQKVVFKQRGKR